MQSTVGLKNDCRMAANDGNADTASAWKGQARARYPMIRGYTDQSANERTFLAWVRTGIAVTAFGLFVGKFELFSAAPAVTSAPDPAVGLPLTALARAIERYDGLALAVLGVAVIILAAVSFVRIQRQLGDA